MTGSSGALILEWIDHWAHTSPNRVALIDSSRVMTFAQLREGISSCASFLSARGVGERQAIGLLLPNSATFAAALLGIATVGSSAILFPPTLTATELRQHCQETGTQIILSAPAHRALAETAGGRIVENGPGDLQVFRFDISPANTWQRGDFLGQLTSGADHLPKVAIRTDAAVWNEIEDFADEIALTARDAVLVLSSIAHSYGLIGGTLGPLCRGGCVILPNGFVPQGVLELIHHARPTILYAVPVMYRALTTAPSRWANELASLRLCFSAGAPLSREVDDGFALRFGRRISQNYGTTEAGVISVRLAWTPRLRESVGRPVRHRIVTIVDTDGRPLSPGSTGAVIVQSPALARGYLDGPHGRETALEGDRFRTGDLGWTDEDGHLFLAGRTSQIIHVAGATIDIAEVERVIAALPGVHEVAVVRVPHHEKGDGLKAVVVAEGLVAVDVLQHCRRHLSRIGVPKIVEFRPALPRTAAGKILRRALRDS
jgi:acyl-CoA synthetase (AMP-forming)/AMP-acid ligase II